MVSFFDNNGFTLVENLVALTILCVGFLAMAGIIGGTLRGRCFSAQVTQATVLAQDKMEDVMRIGYPDLPSADSVQTEDYGSIAGYPAYCRVVSVDAAEPGLGMKTVTITVYWSSPDRHSVKLKTVMAE